MKLDELQSKKIVDGLNSNFVAYKCFLSYQAIGRVTPDISLRSYGNVHAFSQTLILIHGFVERTPSFRLHEFKAIF